jgi:hypothetical protein
MSENIDITEQLDKEEKTMKFILEYNKVIFYK